MCKKTNRQRKFLSGCIKIVGIASAIIVTTPAKSDIRLLSQYGSEPKRNVIEVRLNDDAIRPLLNRKADVERAIISEIGSRIHVSRGIVLRDFHIRLGNPTLHRVSASELVVNIDNNEFVFTSTVPGPTRRSMDPRFRARFNLRLHVRLAMPSATRPHVAVERATVSIPWLSISGRNVTGVIATTLAAVTNWFVERATGRDLLAEKIRPHLSRDIAGMLNSRLRPMNSALSRLHTDGYRVTDIAYNASSRTTLVTMSRLTPIGRMRRPQAREPLTPIRRMGSARNELAAKGGTGGSVFREMCPEGEVVVGITGRTGNFVDQIQLVCAPLSTGGSVRAGGRAATGAPIGGTGGAPARVECPGDNTAIVGFRLGLTGPEGQATTIVRRIALVCGLIDPPHTQIATDRSIGPRTASPVAISAAVCPASAPVAVGAHGRSRNAVNAFGLICGSVH